MQDEKWAAPILNVALLWLGWVVYSMVDFIGGRRLGDD